MLWGQAHGKTEHMLMHMPMRIIIVRFVMTSASNPKVFVVLGVIISPIAYLVNRKMQFYTGLYGSASNSMFFGPPASLRSRAFQGCRSGELT